MCSAQGAFLHCAIRLREANGSIIAYREDLPSCTAAGFQWSSIGQVPAFQNLLREKSSQCVDRNLGSSGVHVECCHYGVQYYLHRVGCMSSPHESRRSNILITPKMTWREMDVAIEEIREGNLRRLSPLLVLMRRLLRQGVKWWPSWSCNLRSLGHCECFFLPLVLSQQCCSFSLRSFFYRFPALFRGYGRKLVRCWDDHTIRRCRRQRCLLRRQLNELKWSQLIIGLGKASSISRLPHLHSRKILRTGGDCLFIVEIRNKKQPLIDDDLINFSPLSLFFLPGPRYRNKIFKAFF